MMREREELARILGVGVDDLDYVVDEPTTVDGGLAQIVPPGASDLPDNEVGAAVSRGLVVPNRISYGVFLQRGGFTGTDVLWKWLGPNCDRKSWYQLWGSDINRFERAGYCRRPQTDSYDIRYKIYWKA